MIAKTMMKRISLLSVVTFIMLGAIEGKLIYSTIMLHNEVKEKADEQHMRSFPLKAPRGLIYDRNGLIIAENSPVLSLYAIPYQVKDKQECASKLANILNMDEAKIFEILNNKTSIVHFSKQGSKLDYETSLKIQRLNIEGLYLVSDYERVYPYAPYLSSLLGFVGSDNQGLSGIESKYENYLKGQKGYLNYYLDAKGGLLNNSSSVLTAPLQGMSLSLTIDLNVQNILEREMDYAFSTYQAEEVSGIIMNPINGEILAIANRPTYDNNAYQDYDESIYNRLLPINNSFEPGSTFKAMTFAAALEEKEIDMFNDTYYDSGYEIVSGTRISSWKKGGHGLQTFLEVLQNSSNPGFVEIARRLGKDKLYSYVEKYGFLEKTNIDIAGENKGLFFSYDNFNELEQATTAFGQGISLTAIQLVRAFSSLINGGILYEPHVVKSIISSTLKEEIEIKQPKAIRRVISKETSDKMRYALECVVALGTGRKAFVEGRRVGGKTGTSQIAENGIYVDGKYLLSFIAGAPMNDPKLVCYFSIKNAKNTVQYGGTTVGPIISRIINDSLKSMNIPLQEDGIERTYTWMDKKTYPVENYVGLTKNKVKSPHFTFVFKGEGNKVIDQIPRVGTLLEESSVILIQLGD